jgi:hypothetical protein
VRDGPRRQYEARGAQALCLRAPGAPRHRDRPRRLRGQPAALEARGGCEGRQLGYGALGQHDRGRRARQARDGGGAGLCHRPSGDDRRPARSNQSERGREGEGARGARRQLQQDSEGGRPHVAEDLRARGRHGRAAAARRLRARELPAASPAPSSRSSNRSGSGSPRSTADGARSDQPRGSGRDPLGRLPPAGAVAPPVPRRGREPRRTAAPAHRGSTARPSRSIRRPAKSVGGGCSTRRLASASSPRPTSRTI